MARSVRSVPAPLPPSEPERLADLDAYDILDSDPEEAFDDIAALASQLFGAPIALVNLIDAKRMWTKAAVGIEGGTSTPREDAFCPHAISAPDGTLVVEDALEDVRFARNPFVLGEAGVRFYAGSSIRSSSGQPIGTVCVVDTEPRTIRADQLEALRALSRLATQQLELRRLLAQERRLVGDLRELDRQKAEFVAVVAHDLRTPLTSIRGYAELLRSGGVAAKTALDSIERGASQLLRLVDELTGTATELAHEHCDLAELVSAAAEVARLTATANGVTLECDLEPAPLVGDPHRLAQALDNLVGNAVKYAPRGTVRLVTRSRRGKAMLEVADNGIGVPAADVPRLFDRFFRASTSERFAGTGVGLAIVKSVVQAHGGRVTVESSVGVGTTFRVELPVGL
jgi:signal transduction histidine kinase